MLMVFEIDYHNYMIYCYDYIGEILICYIYNINHNIYDLDHIHHLNEKQLLVIEYIIYKKVIFPHRCFRIIYVYHNV